MSYLTPHCYLKEATDSSGTDYYKLSVWLETPADKESGTPVTSTVTEGGHQVFKVSIPILAKPGEPETLDKTDYDIYLTSNDYFEVSTVEGGSEKHKAKGKLEDADETNIS